MSTNWLTTEDKTVFLGGIEDLWEMFANDVTVVKSPSMSATVESEPYIYGYGPQSKETNYTYTPISGIFRAILTSLKPSQSLEKNIEKVIPLEDIYLKVEQGGRDFILDGRPNEKVIYLGKSYNIVSEDQPTNYLTKKMYYFKVELTK